MTSCLFCQIADRRIPAKIVYEDDELFAFNDINPQAPVHVLVCPRKHIPTLNDVSVEDHPLLGRLFETAARIARDAGIHERGYRTVFNVNREAGQTVYHLHLHVIGGRILNWP
jgi:histidine triad (HIT) family protein